MISWEAFKVGETHEMGRHTFSADEIVSFARQYDPQPFHTDPQAAQHSYFGGLVKQRWEAVNDAGELVLSMEGWNMFGRRP